MEAAIKELIEEHINRLIREGQPPEFIEGFIVGWGESAQLNSSFVYLLQHGEEMKMQEHKFSE